MGYIDNFSPEFWIVIVGSLIGFFTVVLQQCYKSKCDRFSLCCGLLRIHRNIEAELEIDEINLTVPPPIPPPSNV